MTANRPSRWLPTIAIVAIVVGASVGVYFLYEYNTPKPGGPVPTVVIGSNVTVNYIGSFGSGPQTGRVFDTSYLNVALNNASFPKSAEFTVRSPTSQYTPLGVSVGPNVPSSGYTIDNITFGGVVTGFWQGLLGLQAGQARTIAVPPSQGYGMLDPSCLVTRPLALTEPVLVTVPSQNFSTAYPNVTATVGTEFQAQPYNWTAVVLNVNATAVTVENLPTLGQSASVNGLPALVTAITSSTISIALQVTSANYGSLLGRSSTSVCGSTEFTVLSTSSASGTYVANYNREVVGQTLLFQVSIVKFY